MQSTFDTRLCLQTLDRSEFIYLYVMFYSNVILHILFQAYMEDHLRNENRLNKEWEV